MTGTMYMASEASDGHDVYGERKRVTESKTTNIYTYCTIARLTNRALEPEPTSTYITVKFCQLLNVTNYDVLETRFGNTL